MKGTFLFSGFCHFREAKLKIFYIKLTTGCCLFDFRFKIGVLSPFLFVHFDFPLEKQGNFF